MDSSYYLFTFYVFALVIIVMLIGKKLFSDVKRQNRLLDEKEAKLLKLYQTIEDVMEEFYDTVNDSKQDIDSAIRRLNSDSSRLSSAPPKVAYSKNPKASPGLKPSAPIPPIPAEKPKIIDYIVDDAAAMESGPKPFSKILTTTEEETPPPRGNSVRNESILSLHKKGKSNTEIAKELGITQTEVSLVIGLNK